MEQRRQYRLAQPRDSLNTASIFIDMADMRKNQQSNGSERVHSPHR